MQFYTNLQIQDLTNKAMEDTQNNIAFVQDNLIRVENYVNTVWDDLELSEENHPENICNNISTEEDNMDGIENDIAAAQGSFEEDYPLKEDYPLNIED
ncbi:5044_t:CDS:2, partial [Gigaspora rosea]